MGSGKKGEDRNRFPYKVFNSDTTLMFEEDSALVKPLGLHKNKPCSCVFHSNRLILNKEVIELLEESLYGKMLLEMHNLQRILGLLDGKSEKELSKITAISQRLVELRMFT